MRIRTLVFISMLISATAHADDGWTTTTSDDGAFSFEMPGTPTRSNDTVALPTGGNAQFVQYELDVSSNEIYAVASVDYETTTPADSALDGARDGAARNVGGDVIAEKQIQVDGYPGRDIVIQSGTQRVSARMVIVGRRLYEMLVGGAGDASVKKFFSSLDLLAVDPKRDKALTEASAMETKAMKLRGERRYTDALELEQEVLAVRSKWLPDDDVELAVARSLIGTLLDETGDSPDAIPYWEAGLTVLEAHRGDGDSNVVSIRDGLALAYQRDGRFSDAEPLFVESLAVARRDHGDDSAEVAEDSESLAVLDADLGRLDEGERLARDALAIRKEISGDDSAEAARASLTLAIVLRQRGNLVEAEPLMEHALSTWQAAGDDADVSLCLDNLGILELDLGDLDAADRAWKRAIAIEQAAVAASTPDTIDYASSRSDLATLLHNRALLHEQAGSFKDAIKDYEAALSLDGEVDAPDDPRIAATQANLAIVYWDTGNYRLASTMFQRALDTTEAKQGKDSADVASILGNYALVDLATGDLAKAKERLERSLSIQEEVYGDENPALIRTLANLGWVALAGDHLDDALDALSRAETIRESISQSIIMASGEEQSRAFLATLQGDADFIVGIDLGLQTPSSEATKLAMTTVLRRKGRLLDAAAQTMQTLRRDADGDTAAALDHLQALSRDLAQRLLHGPAHGETAADNTKAIAKLRGEIDSTQTALARRSAQLRTATKPVTVESVQARLADDQALVEIVAYHPFDVKASSWLDAWKPARYAAYVLTHDHAPERVDLGDADTIDADVRDLRDAFASQSDDYKAKARSLDEAVMRPVRELLGDRHRIIISADGSLNLVPFAALVDEHQQFLVQDYEITYVTSGRDLLRENDPPHSDVVLVADPAYGEAGDVSAHSSDVFANLEFDPLPGTDAEATAIAKLFPSAHVLRGDQATKTALEKLAGPRILHLATHGFFLDTIGTGRGGNRSIAIRHADAPATPEMTDDETFDGASIQSGLALAGANVRAGGNDDGILTAVEAANLDLDGTQLAVLSACDTGVGNAVRGDGVYGLRRAFLVAGAETLVTSLWKVDDAATRDLMVAYYQRLRDGEGRAAAMRDVQLAMLTDSKTAHPYYWAAFLVIGDPDALDGSPGKPPALRRPNGCACNANGEAGNAAVLALAIAAMLARRRARASRNTSSAPGVP